VRAYATSAMREATNKDKVINAVYKKQKFLSKILLVYKKLILLLTY